MIVDKNILRVCTSANAPILVRHHCSPLFFLDMHLSSRSAYFEKKIGLRNSIISLQHRLGLQRIIKFCGSVPLAEKRIV